MGHHGTAARSLLKAKVTTSPLHAAKTGLTPAPPSALPPNLHTPPHPTPGRTKATTNTSHLLSLPMCQALYQVLSNFLI